MYRADDIGANRLTAEYNLPGPQAFASVPEDAILRGDRALSSHVRGVTRHVDKT